MEGQVLQHKTEARHLREAVTLVQDENIRLKDELEVVRRQLADATLLHSSSAVSPAATVVATSSEQASSASAAPLSKENQNLLSSIMSRNAKANVTLSVARPQSPILTPNLYKDVPNSSNGNTTQSSWKDKKPIMVHTTLVPEICFGNDFQFGQKALPFKGDDMLDRPWLKMADVAQQDPLKTNPFWASGIVYELVKTFTSSAYGHMVLDLTAAAAEDARLAETAVDKEEEEEADDLAWEVQQSLWALNDSLNVENGDEEDELTEEQIEMLCELSAIRPTSPSTLYMSQEDPNMLEWLYESMMARLVELDLQDSQGHLLASAVSVQL